MAAITHVFLPGLPLIRANDVDVSETNPLNHEIPHDLIHSFHGKNETPEELIKILVVCSLNDYRLFSDDDTPEVILGSELPVLVTAGYWRSALQVEFIDLSAYV